MEAAIDARLTALEERLGLPPCDGSNADTSLDVFALKKKISELGYGFIYKVNPEILKKLCHIGIDPKYATFGQKRATIEFGADLMMERVKLLEQFHKSSEVVLNSKILTSSDELQPGLDSAKQELLMASDDVKKHSEAVQIFKENFCQLIRELQLQLREFDEVVSKAEKTKGVSS